MSGGKKYLDEVELGSGADAVLASAPGAGSFGVGAFKFYQPAAIDPTVPTPTTGDRYFNTTVEAYKTFDGVIWLFGVGGGSLAPALLATTGNIDLTTGTFLTVDGVLTTDGDRILVGQQTLLSENGVYLARAGAWERAPDFIDDAQADSTGTLYVQRGTVYSDRLFKLITDPPITLGTTSILWRLEAVDALATIPAGNSLVAGPLGLKTVLDSGHDGGALAGSFGAPSAANMYVTNTDPRMTSLGGGDFVGPAGAVDENVVFFNGISGKIGKDLGVNVSQVRASHAPSRVATVADVDLTTGGLLTIDGVGPLTAGDRVMVWQQSVPAENGVYEVAAGSWTRVADLDADAEFDVTATVYVQEGDTFANRQFKLITDPPITVGVTAINWALDSMDGPVTVVDENVPVFDGTDTKKVKDSGITLADLEVAVSTGPYTFQLMFTTQANPYITSNAASYTVVGRFIFPGTAIIGAISKIRAIVWRVSGGGSIDIRVFDETNGNQIAAKTGIIDAVPTEQDLGVIAALPVGPVIFTVEMQRTGGGSTGAIGFLMLEF